jgi:hypothetical protein
MSTATTYVSDSDDDYHETTRPSFHTFEALREHLQHYVHLHDLEFLQNDEHYASIRELIWINRAEISGMWKSLQCLQEDLSCLDGHIKSLEHEVRSGFSMLRKDIAEIKELMIQSTYCPQFLFISI